MYFWYKILTYLFYPFAPIYIYFRKIKGKEDPLRYKEKLSKIIIPRDEGFLIRIHMASVGEAMSVLPLIEDFIEDKKVSKILLTSITNSSGKILEKRFNKNSKVVHQFLPIDIPILTRIFLKHWKPNLSIFIDSEIWPNLILEIKKSKIPLLLVNARITKKTFKRWVLVKRFSKKIFGSFDLCISSNKETVNFLKTLGAKNIKDYGNLKFSHLKNNLNKKLDIKFEDKIKDRRIWCAASTHSPEEILCARSHLEIKKKYNNILTIIIPRHINRSKKIYKDLTNLNLRVVLSNNLESVGESTDVILVNSYGEALKFYNISKCVFLGKSLIESLIKDSGQNPIEPARLGCKILHGPNVSNFEDIYKYLETLKITKQINNSADLALAVIEIFKQDNGKNSTIIKEIENYGQNIFKNVMMELKQYI